MKYKLDSKFNSTLKSKNILFKKADLSELEEILGLFSERVTWFKNKGIDQWSKYLEHHPKEEFIKAIQNNYFVLKSNGKIIAGFEVSTDNRFWNNDRNNVYYLYKIVTKVGYKNLGFLIFDICKYLAIINDKKYLRIDCLNSNIILNKIYEKHGFKLKNVGNYDYYNYALRELKVF